MTLFAPFTAEHYADPFGSWEQWRKDRGLGPHRGGDFNGIPWGTPIPASGSGVVVWRTNMSDAQAERTALGHRIVVAYPLGDGRTIRLGYSHLAANPTLAVGSRVALGDPVGLLGNSGSATTGSHLHLTASWTTGDPGTVAVVDPMLYLKFPTSADLAGLGTTALIAYLSEEDDVEPFIITESAQAPKYLYRPATRSKRSISKEEWSVMRKGQAAGVPLTVVTVTRAELDAIPGK